MSIGQAISNLINWGLNWGDVVLVSSPGFGIDIKIADMIASAIVMFTVSAIWKVIRRLWEGKQEGDDGD